MSKCIAKWLAIPCSLGPKFAHQAAAAATQGEFESLPPHRVRAPGVCCTTLAPGVLAQHQTCPLCLLCRLFRPCLCPADLPDARRDLQNSVLKKLLARATLALLVPSRRKASAPPLRLRAALSCVGHERGVICARCGGGPDLGLGSDGSVPGLLLGAGLVVADDGGVRDVRPPVAFDVHVLEHPLHVC